MTKERHKAIRQSYASTNLRENWLLSAGLGWRTVLAINRVKSSFM